MRRWDADPHYWKNPALRRSREKVYRTVKGKKLSRLEHFWKIRLEKCTRDCSESSICTSKSQKSGGIGALLADEVCKMCTRLSSESSICMSKS